MKRKLFYLDDNNLGLMIIFHRIGDLDLLGYQYLIQECEEQSQEKGIDIFEKSAKEFVDQFAGHASFRFLGLLAKECLKRIKDKDDKQDTEYFKKLLDEINKEIKEGGN